MTERLDASLDADVDRAIALLTAGRLVAIPTETVYGLAGLGLRPDVVEQIFAAKGRPSDNPVILHVTGLQAAWPLWELTPAQQERATAVAARFWPGPLTLVLPASDDLVPPSVRAGLPKVAVRCPRHPVSLVLLAELDQPLAAPSANASGRPSPTNADDVLATLDGQIDAVLDGGPTDVGVESTVVDLTEDEAVILRPGQITEADLRQVLARVRREQSPDAAVASPGVRHRHYAPAIGTVELVAVAELKAAWRRGDAVLAPEGVDAPPDALRLPEDPAGYARGLYAALYQLERQQPERLWIVTPGATEPWTAVLDRLTRATERS